MTRRPGLAAVVAALAVGLLVLGAGATPAVLAQPTAPDAGAPGADRSRDEGGPEYLALVEQTPWVAPGGEFAMVVGVRSAPPGAVLSVTLHEARTSRIQFAQSLDGQPGATRDRRCATVLLDGIAGLDPCQIPVAQADTSAGGVTVVLPTRSGDGDPARLPLPGEGVYPVVVTLEDAQGETLDTLRTHLVRLPPDGDASDPLLVNVVLPLALPPALRPNGATRISSDDVTALEGIARALAEHAEIPVVLVPNPDALSALERTDHLEVLADLAVSAADDQVLARPAVDLDVGSWWAAGLDGDIERLMTQGRDLVADTLAVRPDPRTWWVEPTTDEATLARLRASGVDQLVVRERLLEPVDGDLFTLALDRPFEVVTDDGSRVPAVSADAALGAHLGSTGDARLDAHHLLADLALLYFQQPGISRGVAVALPDDPLALPPTFLDTVLEGLSEAPMLEATTVDDLLAQTDRLRAGGSDDLDGPTLGRRLRTEAPPSLGAYPGQLDEARAGLAPYLAMRSDEMPALVVELLDASAHRRLDATERAALLEGALAQVSGVADEVTAPPQASVTLTARQGLIPVEVVNRADAPVRVLVRLESDKLDFPDTDARILDLAPGSNRLEWEVRARTSGAFPVDVVVTSPDGTLELDRSRFTMRSTAVSGIGVALSGLAALFLGVWWIRHWHASRNAALVGAGSGDEGVDDPVAADIDRIIREITDV